MEGKYNTNKKNPYQETSIPNIFDIGEVVSVDDPDGTGRIKVRIKGSAATGGNDSQSNDELNYAFPLLPKFFHSPIKKGESVFILPLSIDNKHINKFYIGPIISQLQKLPYDPYKFSSFSGLENKFQAPNINVKSIPELNGVFTNNEDVIIQGRQNADIVFDNSEIILRAGKFLKKIKDDNNPFDFSFNNKTQAFIQLKDNVKIDSDKNNKPINGSVINLVSSKINLISYSKSQIFDIPTPNGMISDETLEEILNKAYKVPKGEILMEYLELCESALLFHYHNGNTPTDLKGDGNQLPVENFKKLGPKLRQIMLSDNIKIN